MEKVINVQDFSGGQNIRDEAALIADNQGASGTVNVWDYGRSLAKMPGYAEGWSMTSTASVCGQFLLASGIGSSGDLYYRLITSTGGSSSAYFPWTSDLNGTLAPLGYVTGSVSISGASLISATGNGTSWTTHVSAGDYFRVEATGANWFKISSVEDATHLTLSSAVPAAVATGASYTIMPGMDAWPIPAASFIGSLWQSSLSNLMQRFDGTGMTRISAGPKCAFLSPHKNYLFGFRISTATSRLVWSTIKDPTSWPTSNFIDIDKDNNGDGRGMVTFGNELILFKTKGMYRVVGEVFDPSNPTYQVLPIRVPAEFNFNASGSAVNHNGALMFWAMGRVWQYLPGNDFITAVSPQMQNGLEHMENVPTEIGDIRGPQALNGMSVRDFYILRGLSPKAGQDVPSVRRFHTAFIFGTNGGAFPFRTDDTTVSKYSPFRGVGNAIYYESASNYGRTKILLNTVTYPRVMTWLPFAGPAAAVTNYAAGLDATTTAIQAQWESKEFNIGYGHFKRIEVYLKKQSAGNLTVSWSIDQGTYVDNTVDMTAGRGQMIRKVLSINQKGTSIQVKFANSTLSQNFQIYAFRIFYEPDPEDRKA